MLLEAETKLVRDKSLGYLVTTEETPIEKWSPFTLLMRVVSVSLSTLLLIGLPIFAVLSAILSALGTWIPSTLASGIPPIAMAFSGLLGGLSMLLWYYWYSSQPYKSRVVILSNGFIYHDIYRDILGKQNRLAYRYNEIVSVNVDFRKKSVGFVKSECYPYYSYYINCQGNPVVSISSPSLPLMRYVASYICSTRWKGMREAIERGQEVSFGCVAISREYVRVEDFGSSERLLFRIQAIKEIKLCIDSEDGYVFRLEFISGSRSTKSSDCYFRCDKVDNFHLFFKTLKLVGIPMNLSELPARLTFENHIRQATDG